MLSNLSGAVPPLYREVYEIVSPDEGDQLDHDSFIKIFANVGVLKSALSQVYIGLNSIKFLDVVQVLLVNECTKFLYRYGIYLVMVKRA